MQLTRDRVPPSGVARVWAKIAWAVVLALVAPVEASRADAVLKLQRWAEAPRAAPVLKLQRWAEAPRAAPALTLQRGAETLELTLEELAELPQHTVVTTNEFTDTPVAYTGPLARDVLELLALDSLDVVRFTAVNDYFIDVPTNDLHRYEVVLALEADGRRLSRRDKGPLWLMYPLSEHPELAGPVYNARLIWQVVRVDAL